ncbi:MAG: ASKHA domain-containing protein, partial [Sedimentisphaerales bacterium]|nr:ASKHA domain-containing protein [Sedimentisphaerales bacterium]
MRHYNVTFEPDGKRVSIHAGATLLEAAGQAGIILDTICGGKGTCKKCVVNLRRKASPSGEPDSKAVLACQYTIESDVTVTIPPASRFFPRLEGREACGEQKILTEGTGAKVQGRPDVWEKYRDKGENIFGLAVDIGTTTVVVKLLNMKDGRCIATEAELNPQTRYGDDVISRIAYAQSDPLRRSESEASAKLAELNRAIVDCINKLISRLCELASLDASRSGQAHIDTKHIYEVCVVGNTTMNHIFLGFPVAQLGQAPYRAFSVEAHNRMPEDLKLSINAAGNIYTVENIAGFVGSDTTAAALAASIDSADEMTLIVDIGTNGEIVLGTADKLYAASCAAGPALEGARISCGSRASEGAIEAVIANKNDIDLDVIGGRSPRSICGSGLIDATAVLLQLGIIDKSGRFVEAKKLKGHIPPAIL